MWQDPPPDIGPAIGRLRVTRIFGSQARARLRKGDDDKMDSNERFKETLRTIANALLLGLSVFVFCRQGAKS